MERSKEFLLPLDANRILTDERYRAWDIKQIKDPESGVADEHFGKRIVQWPLDRKGSQARLR